MASAVSGDDFKGHESASIVVLDIYPQIMREMINNIFPPKIVLRQIQHEVNQTFMKQLTPAERRMILKLDSDGYTDLDLACLYKVIRYFNLLPPPSKGWGPRPQPEDQSEGDDIERMKRHHSDIIHRPRARLTESERKLFFKESIEIAKRMDERIGSPKNGFESRIQNVQSNRLSQETYVEAIEKKAECQGSLQEVTQAPSFSPYYEYDIEMKLDLVNKQEDEDSKIPEQIKKMDQESIDIYLNALETGSERRRDINLIIVGKKGVGKTSLVWRLFGEELQSVKSTNGIEIHRRRCRINLSNLEWNKVFDTRLVKEASINNRILQSIVKELHQDKEKSTHDILKTSSSDKISTDDNKGTITKNIEHDEEPTPKINYQFAYPEITESPFSKLAKDEHELFSILGSAVDLQDEDGYATLTVWDFAGDIEYYNTHQMFLNPEAIFLVVANLHDIEDTVSYDTFNFWMDTIHCYGSINDKTEAVLLEGAHILLDPPVIAIGTHKDKFQDEEQCRKSLESYTDKIFKDSKLHLRSIHMISNTEDEEHAFGKLKNDIFATAKSSANWNREYPVKFIQMEKAINSELTIGNQIISFERVKELGEKMPLPITDDKELHLFLRYQHESGNVIFFEDIPSHIILDPQWLANAFTCIVTAQQFQLELPHLQWDNFKQTGKMDPKLLEEIFKRQSADMRIHKEHILEVMKKFDIISYPLLLTESGNVQRKHSFYVPCMLQTLKLKDIDVMFNVPNASKSTCLCFVFSFLPPYLISNLIVSCLRVYPPAVAKGEIGLFKDCCVFNIDNTGYKKFVLAKSNHMIQLQVWQWDEVDTEVNQTVLKIVEREINRIVNTRYKLKTVFFEKKWKCETTSFSFDTGFLEFDQVHDGEKYYCEEHATVHKYKDYWSGEKSKAPVRISSEQQNYVRMSMIVLEVLSGVLYDRLHKDTKTGEILDRDKLGITEMCKKYCALKINFPSKGYRKIGNVDDIFTNEDTIGDDIQRIRVIRNEMQHSSLFALHDTRYQTLITIVHDMLTRFDQRNNPAGESYVKRLDEIRKMELKTRSLEEIKEQMKAELIQNLDIQLPWLVDADEFQRMLSDGEFLSYENRLSLGGPCRVGKSTLASVLIGTEIPQTWDSTNGLVIYFGRNGIDIEKKKMVPLKEGERIHDILAKILRVQPDVSERLKQIPGQKTTTHAFMTSFAVETDIVASKSSIKDLQLVKKATKYSEKLAIQTCTSINEHTSEQMSAETKYSAIDEKQLLECQKLQLKPHILDEVRMGQYKIEIAPSDLIDFGGQKSYDMTHQLFIQHSRSFLLMFDGRFDLNTQLEGYEDGVSAASILIHWVDSILMYSEDAEHIMPMILFAATHRDKCQGDTAKIRKEFTSDLKQIFSNHKKKNHIHLDMVYFINGTDKNDEEIQHMTDQVVMFAMKQPSWGQPRPMQWVPLELQISNIRMQNVNIITKDDLRNVNKMNKDLALTGPQLDDFIFVQHSLGKLMHYNIRGLNNFIIIHPPVLVNILRSFVTDEMFFPKEGCLASILKTLTETGKIYKTDLLKLWDRNEYMLNDAIKEFVIELFVHLNILIIPETNRYNRSSPELFIVPSMIKTIKPSNFIDFENQREKTICLKYVLSQQSIPSSLAYTIIGTTLNVWPLKEKENMSCIYHKAAILNVVDDNELRLWVEDDMIEVYLTNQTSTLVISPDITASIQECLTRNLESTLEFYYKSFGGHFEHSKIAKLFSMEVGIPCGNSVCYISLEKAKTVDSWKCENDEEHRTSSLLNWIFDRVAETCKPECKGKTNEELEIQPSDKHLVRFGKYFGYDDSFEDYFIQLGMKKLTLQNIKDKYHAFGRCGIKSIALIEWRESKLSGKEKPTMKSLSDALVASELDNHLLCQIFREETKLLDDANPNLQKIPTDKVLFNLSKQIGNCSLELGIELGLNVAEIEQILFKNDKNLRRLIEDILLLWKRKSKEKTVRNLLMALERVEKGGFNCLSNMLTDSTMFEEKVHSKDRYQKTKGQIGLALIVNYSKNRKGSDEDVRRLEQFFLKKLGYNVKCEHNLKKSDLMDTFDSFTADEMMGKAGTKYYCFVLVMMSHGKKDNLVCVEDHVKVKEIVDKFKLTDFAGKPKYLIFQACREGLEQSYRHAADVSDANGQLYGDDKPLSAKRHQDSDMLLSFATTPGYIAYRKVPHEENQWIGSWFIRALLEVFEKKYKKTDVMKMLEEVRRNLNENADYRPQDGKCQISEDVSTLTKSFFL